MGSPLVLYMFKISIGVFTYRCHKPFISKSLFYVGADSLPPVTKRVMLSYLFIIESVSFELFLFCFKYVSNLCFYSPLSVLLLSIRLSESGIYESRIQICLKANIIVKLCCTIFYLISIMFYHAFILFTPFCRFFHQAK